METITFLHWQMPRWAFMWGIAIMMFAVLKELTRWWLTAGYHLLTVLFLLFTVFYGWLIIR